MRKKFKYKKKVKLIAAVSIRNLGRDLIFTRCLRAERHKILRPFMSVFRGRPVLIFFLGGPLKFHLHLLAPEKNASVNKI